MQFVHNCRSEIPSEMDLLLLKAQWFQSNRIRLFPLRKLKQFQPNRIQHSSLRKLKMLRIIRSRIWTSLLLPESSRTGVQVQFVHVSSVEIYEMLDLNQLHSNRFQWYCCLLNRLLFHTNRLLRYHLRPQLGLFSMSRIQ